MMNLWMNVMATNINLLSFREVLDKANEFISTSPEFQISKNGSVSVTVKNPIQNDGYDELVEFFIYERFARFKFRDPKLLVEYQLDLLPWNMSLNYNIWNDSTSGPQRYVWEQHVRFTDTEEEYFQRLTQQDNTFFTMEELRDAKALMLKSYEYVNIVPVAQEK